MNYSVILQIRRIGAAAALLLSFGCATPPPLTPASYLVLLENADGSSGRVIVNGPGGSTTIEQAGLGAMLDGSTKTPFPVSSETLAKDFGNAIGAMPVPPKTFLLYFETGGTTLTAESQARMAQILAELQWRAFPDMSVVGHTDTVGDASANEALGLTRAHQVGQWLSTGKIHDLEIASHGERNLLVQTPDNTAEPQNRRVEVTIR